MSRIGAFNSKSYILREQREKETLLLNQKQQKVLQITKISNAT